MGNGLDWNLVAAVVFGIFVLIIISRIFYKPLKLLLKALLWTALGGLAIYLYNFVGAIWGLAVGLNAISALFVGLMGLPGLGALVALKFLLG